MLWSLSSPGLIYIFEKIYVASRAAKLLAVQAEILPSNVIALTIERPPTFVYRVRHTLCLLTLEVRLTACTVCVLQQSGQYLQVCCPALSGEYHPFTITSAPHERDLSIHIRGVGDWTNSLIELYKDSITKGDPLPGVRVDGPYGEGHQGWLEFKTVVFVGGGIGVTPFASIIKDLAAKIRDGRCVCVRAACVLLLGFLFLFLFVLTSRCCDRLPNMNRIYFIWLCRDIKKWQWLLDIIRAVEELDDDAENYVFETHIFLTRSELKSDLRTAMLVSTHKLVTSRCRQK